MIKTHNSIHAFFEEIRSGSVGCVCWIPMLRVHDGGNVDSAVTRPFVVVIVLNLVNKDKQFVTITTITITQGQLLYT